MPMKRLAALLLVLIVHSAWARPAPWYWWASKLDGTRVCQQTSPGDGWTRAGGPYHNSRCTDFPSQ